MAADVKEAGRNPKRIQREAEQLRQYELKQPKRKRSTGAGNICPG